MSEYAKPSVTADVILFSVRNDALQVLLIERAHDPYANHWALPGGFVDDNEDLPTAARRELLEETGLEVDWIEQTQTVGTPGRDPRGWTITVAYYTIVQAKELKPRAGDDAKKAEWFDVTELPSMAFDHKTIIERARADLQQRLIHSPAARHLVPCEFALGDLATNLGVALGRKIDENALQNTLTAQGAIEPTSPNSQQHRILKTWTGTLCELRIPLS